MFLSIIIIKMYLIKGHTEPDKVADKYLFTGWEEIC